MWCLILFLFTFNGLQIVSCLECFCDYHCPEHAINNTCHTEYKCFVTLEFLKGTQKKEYRHGCMPPEFEGGIFQCRQKNVIHVTPFVMKCCDDRPFCNEIIELLIPPREEENYLRKFQQEQEEMPSNHVIALVISASVCVSILLLVVTYFCLRYKKITSQRKSNEQQGVLIDGIEPVGSMGELMCSSTRSGPILVQRSLIKQITFRELIGRGRFSEVYRGEWLNQRVAVKIVDVSDEVSWKHEQMMYQSNTLCHENLLGLIGADIADSGTLNVQRVLVTDFHTFGSLYDFLQKHSYDFAILLRLIYSALCGLHYLHTTVPGYSGKPAIAHRNITSRNILVKCDLQCCIADLALAVKQDENTNLVYFNANSKLPDVRYMAPEILKSPLSADRTITLYQYADMYSFSLVLWECMQRFEAGGVAEDYQLPYFNEVGERPTLTDMQNLVCVKDFRPQLPKRYEQDLQGKIVLKFIRQCNLACPDSRLTSLRFKKNLHKYVKEKDSGEESVGSISANTCSTDVT